VRTIRHTTDHPAQAHDGDPQFDDGKILATLPLAGGSDGAMFNPATKSVQRPRQWNHDHRQGEESYQFRGGTGSPDRASAKTLTLDSRRTTS
jgi:hypothetical protein